MTKGVPDITPVRFITLPHGERNGAITGRDSCDQNHENRT